MSSILGSGTIVERFKKLEEIRDGEGALASFKATRETNKMNDIIQLAHILLSECEYLDIGDLERNLFQYEMLVELAQLVGSCYLRIRKEGIKTLCRAQTSAPNNAPRPSTCDHVQWWQITSETNFSRGFAPN